MRFRSVRCTSSVKTSALALRSVQWQRTGRTNFSLNNWILPFSLFTASSYFSQFLAYYSLSSDAIILSACHNEHYVHSVHWIFRVNAKSAIIQFQVKSISNSDLLLRTLTFSPIFHRNRNRSQDWWYKRYHCVIFKSCECTNNGRKMERNPSIHDDSTRIKIIKLQLYYFDRSSM